MTKGRRKSYGISGDNGVGYTTQRVDLKTLSNIKTLNYHLLRRGGRISQSEIIGHAIGFALSKEADFMEYTLSGKIKPEESAFDTLVRITGKPWFPYGNLIQ
jgi:hypothetical protein